MGASSLCRKILAVTLTVFAISSSPLIVFLLPVYGLRLFVSYLATVFRHDLGKMLSPRSNLFAVEYSDMFTKRTRCPLYVSHVVDSHVHVDAFRQFFMERAVNRRCPSGELQSPELQQSINSWLGYLFWQWDEDFKIENHIKYYDGPGKTHLVSDEDIPVIMKELSSRPFLKGRSPWEIWMFEDARLARDPGQEPKTILVVRMHHGLADGYSILRLLAEDIAETKVPMPFSLDKREKPNLFEKLGIFLRILILSPYQLINLSISSWDFNEWHLPEKKLTARLNVAMTAPIPIQDLKEIRKMYGITFNAVLQSAFAGGLRSFMLEHNMKIPKAVHCMLPLPMPGHPGKLRNHMTAVLAPLPVGIESTRERIKSVHQCLRKLQNSAVPHGTFFMLPIVGALPAWVVRILATNLIATCLLSNFPGPVEPVYLMGNEINDIVFGGGLLVGNIGIGLSSLSYNGNIRLGAGIDEAIFQNPEEVRSLVRKIEEELDIMRALEVV